MRKQQRIPAWFDDALIRNAMILAVRLLGDKPQARHAVVDALDKLDARMAVQDKRGYHSVKDPTKVRWSDAQILQNLVIESAGRIARSQEHNSDLHISEATMMIRWIAYLFQIVRDNSFGATVAYAKVLHDPGPRCSQQASDFYDLLQQAPGVKDTTQFPRKRSDLVAKMHERFHPWLHFGHSENGDLVFEHHPNPERFQPLMQQLLRMLAPWQVTPPQIPVDLDPIRDVIHDLRVASPDPEAQNEVEIRRIYSILDQDVCYQLVAAVSDGPWKPVLPRFSGLTSFGLQDRDREGSSRPPECDDEDIDTIRGHFQRRRARRHQTTSGVLRIVVDAEPVDQMNLLEKASVSFSVRWEDAWVEIYDVFPSEPVLLAAIQLSELPLEATLLCTTLRRGQRLTVKFEAASGGERRATAHYYESHPVRRLVLALRRLLYRMRSQPLLSSEFARLGSRQQTPSGAEKELEGKGP